MNLKQISGMVSDLSYNSRYYRKLYHLPLQEKHILIESKSGGDLAGNMFAILCELVKPEYADYKVYLVYTKKKQDVIFGLLKRYGISGVHPVLLKSRAYFKVLATAKYLFTDTSFMRGFVKREGQILTNTWHGTPIKYMGVDVKDRIYAMGNVQRNLMCADYLIYPNEYMKEKMTKSYLLTNLYQGTILNEGYPRNSCFFQTDYGKGIRKELGLEDKLVALYMPTWRGTLTKKASNQLILMMEYYLRPLDYLLQENEVLYVKLHPFVNKEMDFSRYQHIRPYPSEYDTYEFLNMTDVLITDYSSVFYDYANTGKKIVLFPYDESKYIKERGLYTLPEELCFPVVKTTEELYREITTPKNYDDTQFRKECCTYDAPDAAVRICRHVIKGEKCCNEERLQADGKKNLLVFSTESLDDGIPAEVQKVFDKEGTEKNNIFYSFPESSAKRNPLSLEVIPKEIGFLPVCSDVAPTWMEMLCSFLYNRSGVCGGRIKKILQNRLVCAYKLRFDKREFQKHFGSARIDRVIQCESSGNKRVAFLDAFEGAEE